MKLRDVEANLPNGFHDAKISTIRLDLSAEVVDVYMEVLVGLPEYDSTRQNELRPGRLRFKGAKIALIEAPDVEAPLPIPGPVSFVLTEDEAGSVSDELLKKLQCEYHTYTFFVQDWLSNLKIVAENIEFIWGSDGVAGSECLFEAAE